MAIYGVILNHQQPRSFLGRIGTPNSGGWLKVGIIFSRVKMQSHPQRILVKKHAPNGPKMSQVGGNPLLSLHFWGGVVSILGAVD